MKKVVALSLVGVFVTASLFVSSASALPQFKTAFETKYVTNGNPALEPAFKTANCNTCHVKGKEKTVRNEYGQALSKIIGGHAKADIDAAKKISDDAGKAKINEVLKKLDEAFTKVEAEKSKSGETYGEQLKAGKLPQ